MSDFSEAVSSGTYTYEATYEASSDGDYTATLDEATDESGNDGASRQSVTISVEASGVTIIDDFESGSLSSAWSASANGDNTPPEPRNAFEVQSDTVGEGDYALKGNSGQSSGGASVLMRNDFTIDTDGVNLSMYVRIGPTLTGYERDNRVQLGSTENDEFNRIFRLSNKDDGRDSNDGTVVTGETSSISLIEIIDIQFTEGSISEVRVDGEIIEEDIQFENDSSEITRVDIFQGHFDNPHDVFFDKIFFEDN
jgi:hypothetical protein